MESKIVGLVIFTTFLATVLGATNTLYIEAIEIKTADVFGAGMDNIIGGIDLQIINTNFEICEVNARK